MSDRKPKPIAHEGFIKRTTEMVAIMSDKRTDAEVGGALLATARHVEGCCVTCDLRREAARRLTEGRRVDVWINSSELADLNDTDNGSAIIEIREDEEADGHYPAILIIQDAEGDWHYDFTAKNWAVQRVPRGLRLSPISGG